MTEMSDKLMKKLNSLEEIKQGDVVGLIFGKLGD